MPRRVEVSIASDRTAAFTERVGELEGLIGLQVQQGTSRKPEGDVVAIDITARSLPALKHLLMEFGAGSSTSVSFSSAEPLSLVAASSAEEIVNDVSEASWEEMELVLGKNSNMTVNALLVMAAAGVIAAIGIVTNALHLVIGAMLIAPGFQPLVRIGLGMVAGSSAWRRGLGDLLKGYLALLAGAVAAALLLSVLGKPLVDGEASYMPPGVLASYWTQITVPALLVTAIAGITGTILVATNRAVLTAGVMVALALVPGATLTGLGLVAGDFTTAARGALRWCIEVGIVLAAAVAVLSWKRQRVHRRPALL